MAGTRRFHLVTVRRELKSLGAAETLAHCERSDMQVRYQVINDRGDLVRATLFGFPRSSSSRIGGQSPLGLLLFLLFLE